MISKPWCPEGQDLRLSADRVAEFANLVSTGEAPVLRSWMIWQNEIYRANCRIAGLTPGR